MKSNNSSSGASENGAPGDGVTDLMQSDPIDIIVNGAPQQLGPGASVIDLISRLGLDPHRVAVEINRELVRRTRFDAHRIEPGDKVEIVEFVGGG